jgi:hypothetical protein
MRSSTVHLAVATAMFVGLAILAVLESGTPRSNVQTTGCSAPPVSRGHSYSVPLAGYCLVFGAGSNWQIISPLSAPISIPARPAPYRTGP